MKNRHVEQLRRLARQRHRHAQEDYGPGGIAVRYHFQPGLSWWTDTAFVLNDYRVALSFLHPRMAYQWQVEELAQATVTHLYTHKGLEDATPIFRKIGRSRKKIQGYARNPRSAEDPWLNALKAEEARLFVEGNFVVTPYIRAEWTRYSRFVTLCAPVEVGNEETLIAMARLVRRLLKHETTLQAEFPGYAYTRNDWVKDGLAGRHADLLHAHEVR